MGAARANSILQQFVRGLLDMGGAAQAAQILWTPTQFTPEPDSVKRVWKMFDTSNTGLIMGAAKMGKSYSMGARLFLEWFRDPEFTSIRVIGPSETHLEQNLFSHLVALHTNATIPMPGEVGDLFIGLNRRDQLSSIRGIVVPTGNSRKAGRLQGGHRRPRNSPHPVFGPLSRMFIFLDEIENIPNGIWLDIDNVLSEIDEDIKDGNARECGFKIFGAYNPTNPTDEVGKRAEPVFGWGQFDEDTHFEWKSTRGWDVIRLDGERCENVLQGKIIYPGLQTQAGLSKIAANAGGRNGPGYCTMGRGMYPPVGLEATIIPSGMLSKWRGEFIWYSEPEPIASVDLALEGGDDAVYTLGKLGMVSGAKFPPSIEFPKGQTVMFRDAHGRVTPRWGLEADQQFILPKGDTVAMKSSVMAMNRKAGVRPTLFGCDRTGHGAGVADLLKFEWGSEIRDVNYSEGAGEEKLMVEDSKTCAELYHRMDTTLWFGLRMWGEFGYLLLHPSLDMGRLTQQLTQRRFKVASGKSKVESKKDYESRGFGSPNEADSLCLLVNTARKAKGLILSMRGGAGSASESDRDDDFWPGKGEARVDESNRTDFLDLGDNALL